MAWLKKTAQPAPERFAMPMFIEKPLTEERVLALYAKHVVLECGGNKSLAARVLGIDRRSLYRRLELYAKQEAGGAS